MPLPELKDPDIRRHLRAGLEKRLQDRLGVTIVDELCIEGGKVRADLAVISPEKLVGYEIKSDFDSLTRLARQADYYNQLFDEAYLICGPKYVNKVRHLLPSWWGIYTIVPDYKGDIEFRLAQKARKNPEGINVKTLSKLLWRDEAMLILKKHGLSRGLSKSTRRVLWTKLQKSLTLEELRYEVALCLWSRTDWR